jgi:hypothetical protein
MLWRFTESVLNTAPLLVPPDHLLLDSAPNIGPLISRWELEKFKNCWNKSFETSKILTLLYQQISNLLISQRDMSGPTLGALSNKRWSGGMLWTSPRCELPASNRKNMVQKFHQMIRWKGSNNSTSIVHAWKLIWSCLLASFSNWRASGMNTGWRPLRYHPITYYWTVHLILDHSYLVGKLTSSKIGDTKVSGF